MWRDKKNQRLLICQIFILAIGLLLTSVFQFSNGAIWWMIILLIITDIMFWYYLWKQSKKIKGLSFYMNQILNNN